MGQLKVRFTIEHEHEIFSFTSMSDLEQHSLSKPIFDRLNDFERRLKLEAGQYWISEKFGTNQHNPFELQIVKFSEHNEVKPSTCDKG